MKKYFILVFFILAGIACIAQQPTKVKAAKTTVADDELVTLHEMKTELNQMLIQYNKQISAAQATMNKIEALQKKFDSKRKELEAKDKFGNFEIQDLMSQYNQAETQTSSILKKLSDSKEGVIRKID